MTDQTKNDTYIKLLRKLGAEKIANRLEQLAVNVTLLVNVNENLTDESLRFAEWMRILAYERLNEDDRATFDNYVSRISSSVPRR